MPCAINRGERAFFFRRRTLRPRNRIRAALWREDCISPCSKKVLLCEAEVAVLADDYMVENVKLNHLEGIVIPKLGDAREVIQNEGMVGFADRVLMPLPDTACEFLNCAIPALKMGGILHYFATAFLTSYEKSSDLFQGPIEEVERVAGDMGRSVDIKNKRVLRSVGPRKYHIVIDAKIS